MLGEVQLKKGTTQSFGLANFARIFVNLRWCDIGNRFQKLTTMKGKAKDKVVKSVVVVLMVVVAYIICWSWFCCVATAAFIIGGEDSIPR